MHQDAKHASMLTADLQRCRRLVASMRGLVMASSLRLKLLADTQAALAARDERLCAKWERTNGAPPLSPRAQYLREFRGQRIRVIQRQWRKYRWHRIILEKIKLERKWRARRGIKHLETSALLIQRVFRGDCVRRRRRIDPQFSILGTVVLAKRVSRLERLQECRTQYHKRLESQWSALIQTKHDLETARTNQMMTKQKIAKAKTTTNTATSKTTAASFFIDARLLDGTVVRMDAHQLLLHESSEVDRLTETLVSLEADIRDLQYSDGVVHQAASMIQSGYRQYRMRNQHELVRKRQHLASIRLRRSSEICYERMNAGFLKRQQAAWQRSALTLQGFYHILKAKQLLHLFRQKRAVATIERTYQHRRDRVDAHARLARRRRKVRAQLFSLRRLRRVMAAYWVVWRGVVTHERGRRARISLALATGHTKWVSSKAVRLQRVFHRAMELRRSMDDQIMPGLHLVLRYMVDAAVASSREPRGQFSQFYQQVTQTIHAWREPPRRLHFRARRYALPLDILPLDEVWSWLMNEQQQQREHDWFLDLRVPLPIRTLRFLAMLSHFFTRQDRIAFQIDQIWLNYEALQCVRDYLAVLFAHDAVLYTPATTFSAHDRQRAVEWLRQLIREETQEDSQPWSMGATATDLPYTVFHCVRTDLCERCFAMERDRSARSCLSCGHLHHEQSTVVQPSHAVISPLEDEESHEPKWIKGSERCDLIVVNAFFHALAPRGHAHRELYTPETMWQLALAKAVEPVSLLYERLEIRTLNDLLVQAKESVWAEIMPTQVAAKLSLFLRLIKQELVAIHQSATSWMNGG